MINIDKKLPAGIYEIRTTYEVAASKVEKFEAVS